MLTVSEFVRLCLERLNREETGEFVRGEITNRDTNREEDILVIHGAEDLQLTDFCLNRLASAERSAGLRASLLGGEIPDGK